jgi:hypothetical protein
MNKPIAVGDLVQVVRGHICDIGRIFIVCRIESFNWWECPTCGCVSSYYSDGAVWLADGPGNADGSGFGALISWCRKIPPPEELGIIAEPTEITA